MKTLLLLRHAKSSWKDSTQSDHERPLNKRGRETAPVVGELIAERKLTPQLMICSTAVRAETTARMIAEHSGYRGELTVTGELYPTTPSACLSVLREVEPGVESVMLVCHNPGLEELVQLLAGIYERMPTCCLVQLSLPIEDWRDLTAETAAEVVDVWRPREL